MRDQTGLGLPPVSCGDFLDVLWGAGDLPVIALSPDDTLARVRSLVAAGELDAAAQCIAEELGRVGPIVTYARYLAPEERPPFLRDRRVLRYACELNVHAATIAMRQKRWQDGRACLLHAVTADPDSVLPRAHLVEVYVETGAFRAARELLASIVESRPICSAEMFNLGVDLLDRGAPDEAAGCFAFAEMHDRSGTFRRMTALHQERIKRGDCERPDAEVLQQRVSSALELRQVGEVVDAQALLLDTVCWLPRHGPLWHLLGLTYLGEVESAGINIANAQELENKALRLVEAARDAFALAVHYQSDPIEAKAQLEACRRALGDAVGEATL